MIIPRTIIGLLLALPATALPWPQPFMDSSDPLEHNSTLYSRADPADFYLRILPLGASIVAGEYSQDKAKNGFRKFTRDKLRERGWKVNMVGTKNGGTMADNVSCKEIASSEQANPVRIIGPRGYLWRSCDIHC